MRKSSFGFLLLLLIAAGFLIAGPRLFWESVENSAYSGTELFEIYTDADVAVTASKLINEGKTTARFITPLDDTEFFLAYFNAGTWKAVDYITIRERRKDGSITLEWHTHEADEMLESLPGMAQKAVDSVITPGMTNVQKYKALHDWLILNCEYDQDGVSNFYGQSSWTVFNDGIAVCEGYANAFKLLCDMAGLPCVVVSGTSGGVPHGWNMVPHDGRWLYIDPTFDDPIINGRSDYNKLEKHNEKYFMLTESEMYSDHELNLNFFLLAVKLYPDWEDY